MEAIKTENLYELVVCSLFEEIRKLRGTNKYMVDLIRVTESIQDYMIKLTVDQ